MQINPQLFDTLEQISLENPRSDSLNFIQRNAQVSTYSNHQLVQDAKSVAQALHSKDIQSGDVVLLAGQHDYSLLVLFWACCRLSAIASIVPYFSENSSTTVYARRMQDLALQAQAKAIIVCPAVFVPVAKQMASQSTNVIDQANLFSHAVHDEGLSIQPQSIAYIQYSSGSTSAAKGAILSQQAVIAHCQHFAKALEFTADDTSVGWLPFFHDMGLVTQMILPLLCAAKTVFLAPDHWSLRPHLLFKAITKYQGSMCWMPNFGFNHCLHAIRERHLQDIDLSSLRIMGSGSEPVQADSLRAFQQKFEAYGLNKNALMVGYGMAENVVAIAITPPQQTVEINCLDQAKLQTQHIAQTVTLASSNSQEICACGYVIDGTEMVIFDDQMQPLPDNHIGEIAIKGNSCFDGYLNIEHSKPNDWFLTGDFGYLRNKQLFVSGRKKDLIIIGGKNIQPHDIEQIANRLMGHYHGRSAAFGVYDQQAGTEMAVLVCEIAKASHQLGNDIRQQVLYELDVRLADVLFVARGWVEKTTSGKISRSKNRLKYLSIKHADN